MELLPPPRINIKHEGFTLVELSIVMIIIGLLIGGIFGGMKLIDNANVQKTVQDLKSIESASLTFKDTYRALPGDIRNPSTRLPNCTDAPCATGGDGNRRLTNLVFWNEPLTATMEKFTFWHHLQAANLISMDFHNTTDMNFGEGQPSASITNGYRVSDYSGDGWECSTRYDYDTLLVPTNVSDGNLQTDAMAFSTPCGQIRSVDQKIDDGVPIQENF
jgi:prepilin-type N-terminal cleavage/methylation domain-containing protein